MYGNTTSSKLTRTATASQWLQQNGAQYHDAFSSAIETVTPQARTQIQFTKDTFRSISEFQEYIASVKESKRLKTYEFLTKYNRAGGHANWADVQNEAQTALQEYKMRGDRNWFVRAARGTGKKVPAIQSWLGLVSGNEFATIACGILSLFFGAATALSKVRTTVQSTIESLASTVDETEDMLQIYRHDKPLCELAEQLFVAILDGTREMIKWLNSHGSTEAFKALITQNSYAGRLNESMELIKEKTTSFRDKANFLFHSRLRNVDENTYMTYKEVMKINEQTAASKAQLERIEAQQRNQCEVLNRFTEFLAGSQQFSGPAQTNKDLAHLFYPPIVYIQTTSTNQILEILNVPPIMTAADLAQAKGYFDGSTEVQSRGLRVLDDMCFRSWCASNCSEMVLVNDLARDDSSAALTTVSARFIEALVFLKTVVPLVFFCGAHTARDDHFSGTHGLMRSMNHQLLQQFKGASLSFVDQELLDGLPYDIRYQCELFRGLLRCMQSTTIFCVIDGISELDNSRYGHELPPLVEFFRHLVMEFNGDEMRQETGPTLKVMFTAPAMGATLAGLFWQEKQVSIPDWDHDMIPGMEDSFMQNSVSELCDSPFG